MPLIRKPPSPIEAPPAAAGLTSPDVEERWRAARAMAGRPEAVAALGSALGAEMDARVREAMFSALARTGTPEAATAILPYIRSDDANLRTAALDALKTMSGGASFDTAALLKDPDVDVRVLACELARNLPSNEATPLLCTVLETDPDANVCASAVEVLAEVGEPAALPALAICAERFPDERFLSFAIRLAAERIGGAPRG